MHISASINQRAALQWLHGILKFYVPGRDFFLSIQITILHSGYWLPAKRENFALFHDVQIFSNIELICYKNFLVRIIDFSLYHRDLFNYPLLRDVQWRNYLLYFGGTRGENIWCGNMCVSICVCEETEPRAKKLIKPSKTVQGTETLCQMSSEKNPIKNQ